MDVSNQDHSKSAEAADSDRDLSLGGQKLIETVVTLSGLPEPLAHQELDQILKMSGHTPGDRPSLTLDELREALLVYLEALQPTSVD